MGNVWSVAAVARIDNAWEIVEAIDLWIVDSESVGCRFDSYRAHHLTPTASSLYRPHSGPRLEAVFDAVPRIVPTQPGKRIQHRILGGVNVTQGNADIRMPGDTCQRPHITAALPQAREKRVPNGIDLEGSNVRQSQHFLVLEFQTVVVDVPLFRFRWPDPSFTWLPGQLPTILQHGTYARTEGEDAPRRFEGWYDRSLVGIPLVTEEPP